jgi:putative membrane protein
MPIYDGPGRPIIGLIEAFCRSMLTVHDDAHMRKSDTTNQSSLDPRVGLAAERTLLAWIRTSLALMGFGFVVARFGLFLREITAVQGRPLTAPTGISYWIGGALLVLGVAINVLATIQHIRLMKRLAANEPYRPQVVSLSVILAVVLAVVGGVMTIYVTRSMR